MIPVSATLSFVDDAEPDEEPLQVDDPEERARVISVVEKRLGTKRQWHGLSPDAALELLRRPVRSIDEVEQYSYGPILEVHSIEVDGARIAIHALDKKGIMLRSGNATGSCPVAYTFRAATQTWQKEGEFLVGRRDPTNLEIDRRVLRDFEGVLRLAEEEVGETSHVNKVSVECRRHDGTVTVFAPSRSELEAIDSDEIVLSHGDSVDVSFRSYVPMDYKRCWLNSHGYYETSRLP
jgi:hypothetical protein